MAIHALTLRKSRYPKKRINILGFSSFLNLVHNSGSEDIMKQELMHQVEHAWMSLAQQFNWRLSIDLATLKDEVVDQVTDQFNNGTLDNSTLTNKVKQFYYRQLYNSLLKNDQLAAEDLMMACFQAARSYGIPESQIPDLAAETVRIVIQSLSSIKEPHFLLSFAFVVLRRLSTKMAKSTNEILESDLPPNVINELPSNQDIEKLVEQDVISNDLLTIIKQSIPNALQREVLIRWIILGEPPRDIAQNLDIPVTQVRLAKTRALDRLRNNEEAMKFFHSLRKDED